MGENELATKREFDRDTLDLIKRTVAKNSTDEELRLFLYQAKRTGLDPLSRQIHFVKRWDSLAKREVGAVQTGIDGFRLIASRTGRYRPDEEAPVYTMDGDRLISAKVKVNVYHPESGSWFPVTGEAFFQEYCQKRNDGKPNFTWGRMPHVMLSKCAEAIALRKAFPAELSGIYINDEMPSAEPVKVETSAVRTPEPEAKIAEVTPGAEKPKGPAELPPEQGVERQTSRITDAQRKRLYGICKTAGKSDAEVKAYLKNTYGVESSKDIDRDYYRDICEWAADKNTNAQLSTEPREPGSDDS